MELIDLVGNVVFALDAGPAGIVVVKFPRRDGAIILHTAFDIDHSGRTKVGPGKLLFARPDELDWFAGCARQPRRLDGAFAGMFAAIARTALRHDPANFL